MEKKYQIFISSTYEDLKEERKKVQDTILAMYHFPIGMEMFSAADEEQWEIIKETIDSSDFYVLIIGHRYGSVIEEGEYAGISYTEKEFRYALENKIPVLAFLIGSTVRVTPDKMEKDNPKKLEEFKESVKTGRMVQWWTSIEDLSNKVMNALNKQINRGKRPGWIRADTFNIEETQKELVDMSKKIRKLEEENNKLKSQIIIRKPQLEIKINDDKFNIKIPYYKRIFNYIDCKYLPLTMEDIPSEVKHEITQEMLDEYNKKLPPKEVVEEYKRKMHFYKQANDCPFDIKLTVCNYGNAKANDVYVEVYFPNEIKVYRKNNIEDISMPEAPEKPENPINKYYQDKTAFGNFYSSLPAISSISRFLMSEKMPNPFDITEIDAKNQHFYNDDNSLSIRIKDLMTGYTWNIQDKYILVPTEVGTFEIKCTFMCDEYEESLKQVIQVVVE